MRRKYQIVQSDQFVSDLEADGHGVERADECVFGVDWKLARSPECGLRITEDVWCIELSTGSDQTATIYYTFNEDEKQVMFHRFKVYEAPKTWS